MFFEVSNDLVPILLSVSLYLTFIAAHVINGMAKEYVVRHRYMTNRDIHSTISLVTTDDQFSEELEHKQSFLTRIVKRKEAPEDDGDYHYSSTTQLDDEYIRGGQHQWIKKTVLYLHSLKSMAY